MKYIDDTELYYEVILSQGRGVLTSKAERMFVLIAKNVILKKIAYYQDTMDYDDCLQEGILQMLLNWHKFNGQKYSIALPYFTELFKRGMAAGYNQTINKRRNMDCPEFISIDNCMF